MKLDKEIEKNIISKKKSDNLNAKDKKDRQIFCLGIVISFGLIFIFNLFTPNMSDDLIYGREVAEAASLLELVRQEYEQYMNWSGRSVCHMVLRLFLSVDKMMFNVANSLAVVLLFLFVYWNVDNRKKHDIRLWILINLIFWFCAVQFPQTVLWETGACNYLWGSTIIMGYLTLFRQGIHQERVKKTGVRKILFCPIIFLLGILAGWCNENTSGGGILMVLLMVGYEVVRNRKSNDLGQSADAVTSSPERKNIAASWRQTIRPWMICGFMGQCIGFLFMLLAPGNMVRAGFQTEEHSGWFAYVSRFQKIILAIRENFLILLVLVIVLLVIIWYQDKKTVNSIEDAKDVRKFCQFNHNAINWLITFAATCFALILTTEPMPRAYFGAGIFLMVAAAQLFVNVTEREKAFAALKSSLIAVGVLIFFFQYVESGAHLMRIYREFEERDAYLTQKAEEGAVEVTIPMLRPDFDNPYTYAYDSDVEEEKEYWINIAYAGYYGLDWVSGVPREEWTEY